MTYQALTRKWRPQTFQEIIGQDHITRTLVNAISLGRINHAYLFAGPHGTGKTSTARVLAKALNCEKGPVPDPCNRCSSCLEITRGESLDVLEIDGASNRGIDEIRQLRERISTSPMKGRFRVYIIDEVHMLTGPAFNALLKTLEEPPSHAIFIFATTDPEKVPLTIISRCQRFDFKKIGFSDILARLEQIIEKENIKATPSSLKLIAKASENSMRDAEKILDQLISYTGGNIKEKDVIKMLGMVELDYLAEFTENLYRKDAVSNIKLLHRLLKEGKDPFWIIKGWVSWLRDIMMLKLGEKESLFFYQESGRKLLEKQKVYFSMNQLLHFTEELSSLERKIHTSTNPDIYLELAVVKLSSKDEGKETRKEKEEVESIYRKIVSLEKKIKNVFLSGSKDEVKEETSEENFTSQNRGERVSITQDSHFSEDKKTQKESETHLKEGWKKVIEGVKARKKTLGSFLEKMEVISIEENLIVLGSRGNFLKEMLKKDENKRIVWEELRKFFPEKISLQFKQILPQKNQRKKSSSLREIVAQAIEIFEGEVVGR